MPDKRLIDANASLKKIAHHTMHDCLNRVTFDAANAYEKTKGAMFEIVAKAPTIDAVEVVHAMWLKELRGIVRCSYCDRGYRITNGGANVLKFFYCPNCGAKMDGGANDEKS